MTFDAQRAQRPHLGYAVYAYEPGGPVTLEILIEGATMTFTADTLEAAFAMAFPQPEPPAPEPEQHDEGMLFE